MELPFANLPELVVIDSDKYYNVDRDICYWGPEKIYDLELVNDFIYKAKQYNYTEEQALAVLVYNEFDIEKSNCDLQIYRPIKGLSRIDPKHIVKMMSEGIIKSVRDREHRDFDEILLMFSGYTVGDVLGAYAKHRYLIQKETYKVKRILKKTTRKPYAVNGYMKEYENGSWSESCSDTQFQRVFKKHHQLIMDCSNMNSLIAQDLQDSRQTNGGCLKISELKSELETDSTLTLLRKMNKKRNKHGSALDKNQLLTLLNSETTHKAMDNVNGVQMNGPESNNELKLEEKFLEFAKSGIRRADIDDDLEDDEEDIDSTFKLLCDRHEAVLNSFKHFLPDPNSFQQLSHKWDNMDIALLLLGLSEFGHNFHKISDAIFSKSEAMVHSFYLDHEKEFNLFDIVCKKSSDEAEPVSKESLTDSIIPSVKIKQEPVFDESSSTCQSVSNDASQGNKPSENKRSKKKLPSKESKKKMTKFTVKEEPDVVEEEKQVRNLRSRPETKEILKSLIYEEKRSKNFKCNSNSNSNQKRHRSESSETSNNQNKRSRRKR